MNRNRLRLLAVAAILLVLCVSGVSAQTWTKELANGVTLTQIIKSPSGPEDTTPPMVINILKVDPKVPGVRVQAVLGHDKVHGDSLDKGQETVGSMVTRVQAVAAVNGDFYKWIGDPSGLYVSRAELISEPHPRRTVFGVTSDGEFLFDRLELDAKVTLPEGKWFPIRGINRARKQHELVAYTSKFFTSTTTSPEGSEAVITTSDLPVRLGVPIKGAVSEARSNSGDTLIPEGAIVLSGAGTGQKFVDEHLKPGAAVSIEFNVKPSSTTGWEKVVEAVGGTPRLIRNGKISVEVEQEGGQPGFYARTHPRTAIGVTADGKLVLVTVDGRQSISAGMKLSDLAKLMQSQGCVEALNLDGGGSTTMAAWFGVLNSPSGGIMREVANGLAVFADDELIEVDANLELGISPLNEPIESGTTAQLALLDAATGEPLNADLANRAIWSATGGMGFVDQSGRVYGIKAREGEVAAKLGSRIARIPVKTVAGPASTLTATLEADATGTPNRSTLVVSVTDLNDNSVQGQQVSVRVVGGTSDQASLTTAQDGKASTGITWDAAPGTQARVTVTAGELAPVVVQRAT